MTMAFACHPFQIPSTVPRAELYKALESDFDEILPKALTAYQVSVEREAGTDRRITYAEGQCM